MIVFDAHCDTAEKILDKRASLYLNSFHNDIFRMKKYEGFLQVFAICVYPAYRKEDAFIRADKMIDALLKEFHANRDFISLCLSCKDIEIALKDKKIAALISLEGASPICGRYDKLCYFYKKGVRILTLTWNDVNELGSGALSRESKKGLTAEGISMLEKMEDIGIIVDVSHLSDKGFYDVLKYSKRPFMASHSNARSICGHKRNLTDNMIESIIGRRGYIGLNLYPPFLSENINGCSADAVEHAKHIFSLGGSDILGLGCDFDGIDCTPEDISDVSKLNVLAEKFEEDGFGRENIENIFYRNFMSFLERYGL